MNEYNEYVRQVPLDSTAVIPDFWSRVEAQTNLSLMRSAAAICRWLPRHCTQYNHTISINIINQDHNLSKLLGQLDHATPCSTCFDFIKHCSRRLSCQLLQAPTDVAATLLALQKSLEDESDNHMFETSKACSNCSTSEPFLAYLPMISHDTLYTLHVKSCEMVDRVFFPAGKYHPSAIDHCWPQAKFNQRQRSALMKEAGDME